ncbi:MAG: sigma 54-interacting transcriptional regulator [Acidobacteriota bacterium]
MADRSSNTAAERGSWRAQLVTETHETTLLDAGAAPHAAMLPGLTILHHPDLRRIGDRVALPELLSGRAVALSRLEPELAAPGGGSRRPLADSHLSRTPIELRGVEGGQIIVERGAHRGRVAIDGRPLEEHHGFPLDQLEDGVVLVLSSYVALLIHWLDPAPTRSPGLGLVGESPELDRLRREILRVARLEVPVLLRGETGTGKELVAQAIHRAGKRAERDCVVVNMAEIPSSLAASELFGSVKGAFTGADRTQVGFFQRADGGTLFLDEIGETPPEAQALLLRALESHEIQPVGARGVRRVDVRVIAATDADLEAAIAEGRFRAPLLHRLAGYEIRLPALRQRRDDTARLLLHFLEHELTVLGVPRPWDLARFLPLPLMVELVTFSWPGNVRQLRNVARRLAILDAEEPSRRRAELAALLAEPSIPRSQGTPKREVSTASVAPPVPSPALPSRRRRRSYRKPAEVAESELLAALREHDWRLKPTAEALGVSRASLYLLIEGCSGIRKAADLGREEIEAARSRAGDRIVGIARHLEVSEQGLKRRMTQLGMRRTD